MDFQPRPKQPDLLAESLSDAEVHTLLERLGSREFGGPETATLGAVVEATGSDAATVGRLLAEIRKEDFEKRFGLQLKDHGRRIETLERKSRAAESRPLLGETRLLRYQEELAQEELIRQENRIPVVQLVMAVIGLVVIVAVMAMGREPSPEPANRLPVYTQPVRISLPTSDGKIYLGPSEKIWVELKKGGTRKATPEEQVRILNVSKGLFNPNR